MSKQLFKIDQLGFSVDGKDILKNISFTVNEGELITISGPSGSGKSTLLKIIATMLPKTTGSVSFNGKDIDSYQPTDYRKDVSYFFQSPVLFGETVKDNLMFPFNIRDKGFDEERAITLLESFQLSKDYLDKTISSLSGGEKQRIAFVRNLLFEPKVILLDEITSALDTTNSQLIQSFIQSLNKDKDVTILWITHDEEEYQSSNRRLFIEDGKLKEDYHG
ncbi:MAG: ABC transporter ATP-binding protein [Vagococcus sp.]